MHYIELTEGTRSTAWSVSEWFLREYLHDKDVSLTIEEMDLSLEGVDGWCVRESDTRFTIQIDTNLEYDFIQVLLHELYHVTQYIKDGNTNEYETYHMELELLDKYMNKE
tara:strand:+ start:787 stop:1116 length:330 start_codon:yes stop_codon:yes gene_type:complete